MTTTGHTVKIKWRELPDDKKQALLNWLEKTKKKDVNNRYNIVFYHSNGRLHQVRANLPPKTIANIREHTNALAVISI